MSEWIPVTYREPTAEEKDWYGAEYMYNCKLPEDGQDVLITTNSGSVTLTTFYTDFGCYFEDYECEGEVVAWMPLPEPYTTEGAK